MGAQLRHRAIEIRNVAVRARLHHAAFHRRQHELRERAFVRVRRDARSGQIVVARVDDAITVKLLKIGKDRIRLLPRNPDYAPIEVQPDQDFAIEGLYCGLVRPNR